MIWDSKYELGIPEMDEQHKKWFNEHILGEDAKYGVFYKNIINK
jgi:hemerythrin